MNLEYDNLISRYHFYKGVYEAKKKIKKDAEVTIKGLIEEEGILKKVEKTLKYLVDKFAKNDLKKMDKLITYGLNTVFPDRDIRFESEIMERGQKIWVNMKTIYNGNTIDPQSRSSVHVIESFLLRLLCVLKMNRAKFLFMDETFSAVDYGYVDNVGKLLNELSSKLSMNILLVTHSQHLAGCAEKTYTIKENPTGIKIEK